MYVCMYVWQRLGEDIGMRLAFIPPVVVQIRNSHNYLADFDSEGGEIFSLWCPVCPCMYCMYVCISACLSICQPMYVLGCLIDTCVCRVSLILFPLYACISIFKHTYIHT